MVASNNGNVYKNGGTEVGVEKAFNLITKGSDVLDALIAGVNNCELDPADSSVGSCMVVVDALNNSAAKFYSAHGFIQLPDSLRCVVPMQTIKDLLTER